MAPGRWQPERRRAGLDRPSVPALALMRRPAGARLVTSDHARRARRRRARRSSRLRARSARSSARSRTARPRPSGRSRRVPDYFRTVERPARRDRAARGRRTPELAAQLDAASCDRNRLERARRPDSPAAQTLGYALVPAQVVAIGPAQSFSQHRHDRRRHRAPGVAPDMTVAQHRRPGRPGRRGHPHHRDRAADRRRRSRPSAAGSARAWSSASSTAAATSAATAGSTSSLVDHTVVADAAATRSSPGAATTARRTSPGVPIGTRHRRPHVSPRELRRRAVVKPFVDFSVARPGRRRRCPSGDRSDRGRDRGRTGAAPMRRAVPAARARRAAHRGRAWSLQVSVFAHFAWRRRRAQPRAARRGRAPRWSAARSTPPCSASPPGSSSTSRRRPTTPPAAGRSRSSSSATSRAGSARTRGRPPARPSCCTVAAGVVHRHLDLRPDRPGARATRA